MEKETKEYGIIRMYFPNGTIVYIEYEALNKEVGRNENGIIYETVFDSIKIIKKEITYNAKILSPQIIVYGYKIFYGNPAKTWVYKQISFGYTFPGIPAVTLGENLAYGEWGILKIQIISIQAEVLQLHTFGLEHTLMMLVIVQPTS
jgi:hypothetical protein